MKKYNSIGELLVDFRQENNISQSQFAANVNVDIRTVRRWETGVSRVTPEKEEEIVLETMLPYQLILNLNASVVIPTFYNFQLRKYSLTGIAKKLPKTTWFKEQINVRTKRLRSIDFEFDIDYIMRFLEQKQNNSHKIRREVIHETIKVLPELNQIIVDDTGFYAGHSLYFSITKEAYFKLKNREISKEELGIKDLCNYKTQECPIIFAYDSTADCNDNFYYLVAPIMTFLSSLPKNEYTFCVMDSRFDYIELLKGGGIEIVWEESGEFSNRFYEGNFSSFLSI